MCNNNKTLQELHQIISIKNNWHLLTCFLLLKLQC